MPVRRGQRPDTHRATNGERVTTRRGLVGVVIGGVVHVEKHSGVYGFGGLTPDLQPPFLRLLRWFH